jgi:hypothetical protein
MRLLKFKHYREDDAPSPDINVGSASDNFHDGKPARPTVQNDKRHNCVSLAMDYLGDCGRSAPLGLIPVQRTLASHRDRFTNHHGIARSELTTP